MATMMLVHRCRLQLQSRATLCTARITRVTLLALVSVIPHLHLMRILLVVHHFRWRMLATHPSFT